MKSPVAMISYSRIDAAAAELLHDELALRRFDVVHDRYSFTEGSRIPADMTTGVETCDLFVPYLTPSSLYLGRGARRTATGTRWRTPPCASPPPSQPHTRHTRYTDHHSPFPRSRRPAHRR